MQSDNQPPVDPTVDLMEALNAAAARLQRAAHSRQDVLDAFVGEIRSLGLRGAVHLFDPDGQTLRVVSVALPHNFVPTLEKLAHMPIRGYEVPWQKIHVFRSVVENGATMFVSDSSEVVTDLLPDSVRRISKKILNLLGNLPSVYAPLIAGGQVIGVLNVDGQSFTERTQPVITAFANHLSVALQNADLMVGLKTSEDFSQATLDSLGANVAVIGRNGRIVAVNQAWNEFGEANGGDPSRIGIGADYFQVNLTGEETLKDDFAAASEEGIRGVFESRSPVFEMVYPCHSPQEQRWFSLRATPFRSEAELVVIVHTDITNQVLAEQAQRESETLFRTVIESISAAAFMFQGTRMVFANNKAEELTGYSSDELLKMAFWELVHPDMQPLVKERGMQRQQGGSVPASYEVKLLTKQGEVRWVEFTGSVVDYEGQPAVLGTAFDITQRKQAEAQLQESETRFRRGLDTSPDVITITTLKDGRYVYANQGFIQLSGYSEDELLGRSAKEIGIWSDYRQRGRMVKQLKEAGTIQNYEVEFRTRGGRRVNGLLSASLIELDGKPHILQVIKDVSALAQTQAQLEESEARFRTLVEHATEAIVILNGQTLQFVEANPAAEALYGLGREGLLKVGPVELSPAVQPDGRSSAAAAKDYVQQALADKVPVFEWVHCRSDKSEVLCEVRLVRLPGRDKRVRGSLTDISARARTEEQMRVQSKALEAAGDAILIADSEGAISWVNPAFTRLTGYLPQEVIGQNPRMLKSGVTPQEVYAELWQTVKAGAIWQGELVNRRKDGSLYVESQVITPVFGAESRISHFIAIKRDITKQRQRERRLQAIVQVSQALRLAESTEQIGQVVVEQIEDLMEAQATSVTLLRTAWGDYEITHATGRWKKYMGIRIQPGESVTGLLVKQPETYINNDLELHIDPRFTRPEMWAGMSAGIGLPLEAHGTVVGVLWVGRNRPFLPEDVQVLEATANIAAGALHRAELDARSNELFEEARLAATELAQQVGNLERAKEEIDQRNLELSRLYRASEALLTGSTPDPRQVAEQIVQLALEEFGQANCSVLLVKPGERELIRAAVGGVYADEVQRGRLYLDGKGLAVRAVQEAQIVNAGDVRSLLEYVPNWKDAQSEIAIPLKAGDRVLGVIDIQSAQLNAFGEADMRVLSLFAERAALALENARLFEDVRVHIGQLEALRDIDIAITSSLDIQLTLKVLLDQVLSQLKADAAAVMLLDNDTLRYTAGRGFATKEIEHSRLRLGEGLLGKSALERRFIGVPNLESTHPEFLRGNLHQKEGFRAYFVTPLIAKGEVLGALEIFHREPFEPGPDWMNFLKALAEQAAIAVNNAELFDRLQRAKTELEVAYSNTLRGWVRALDLRDKETEGHTQRVTELTARLAVLMGLPAEELQHITRGALLHDIGKMAIPDGVLLKPGPLNAEERELIEKHTEYARQFLSEIDYLRPALDIPVYHHERWNGSGYPNGLKGEEIPLAARIFAVVDVWDALTSDRPYRKAWSTTLATEYLREGAGVLFDAKVVRCFMEEILGEEMTLLESGA